MEESIIINPATLPPLPILSPKTIATDSTPRTPIEGDLSESEFNLTTELEDLGSPPTPVHPLPIEYHEFKLPKVIKNPVKWKMILKLPELILAGTISIPSTRASVIGGMLDVGEQEEEELEGWLEFSKLKFEIGNDEMATATHQLLTAFSLSSSHHCIRVFCHLQPDVIDSLRFRTYLIPSLPILDGKVIPFREMNRIFTALSLRQTTSTNLLEIFETIESPALDDETLAIQFPALYKYQRMSLAKMIAIEQAPEIIVDHNWQEYTSPTGIKYFIDNTTSQVTATPPKYTQTRGGILAEAPGTGKTHIIISLAHVLILVLSTLSILPNVHPHKIFTDLSIKFPFEANDKVRDSLIPRIPPRLCELSAKEEAHYQETIRQEEFRIRNLPKFPLPSLQLIMRDYIRTRSIRIDDGSSMSRKVAAVLVQEQLNKLDRYYFSTSNPSQSHNRTRESIARDGIEQLYLAATTLVIVPSIIVDQWQQEVILWTSNSLPYFIVKNEVDWVGEDFSKYGMVIIADSALSGTMSGRFLEKLSRFHWKRLVIDEGHSIANKNQSTEFAKSLRVDHRWIVDATPTTNLSESREGINGNLANQTDLAKLCRLFEFLKAPAASSSLKWRNDIVAPFLSSTRNGLQKLLNSLIVKTTSEDIETRGYGLPELKVTIKKLRSTEMERLGYNLLLSLFLTNSITSQRVDDDYFFSAVNASSLSQLTTNLSASTFFYTSNQDAAALVVMLENMKETLYRPDSLEFSDKALSWSDRDRSDLQLAIGVVEEALSSSSWLQYRKEFSVGVEVIGLLDENLLKAFGGQEITKLENKLDELGSTEDNCCLYLIPLTQLNNLHHIIQFCLTYESFRGSKLSYSDEQDLIEEIITIKQTIDRDSTSTRAEKLLEWQEQQKKKGKGKNPPRIHQNPSLLSTTNQSAKPIKLAIPRQLSQFDSSTLLNLRVTHFTTSAKLNYILNSLKSNPTSKYLLFCDVLPDLAISVLADALELFQIKFKVFSSVSILAKEPDFFARFNEGTVEDCQVLIIRTKLAGRGIHLTGATRVIFIEPVWKAATYTQAVKRAHRLGQTSVVHVEILGSKFESSRARPGLTFPVVIADAWDDLIYTRRSEMKAEDLVSVPESDEKLAHHLQSIHFLPPTTTKEISSFLPIPFLVEEKLLVVTPKKKRVADEEYGSSKGKGKAKKRKLTPGKPRSKKRVKVYLDSEEEEIDSMDQDWE